MLNAYIFRLYLKYFLIILLALELFYVGFDYLGVYKSLPGSANLKMLYLIFTGGTALQLTLPLSLIFGMIAAKIYLIRFNELVSLYALGASRTAVLRPFILIAATASVLTVAAYTTPFAYFEDRAEAIRNGTFFASSTEDLFLKFNEDYIYIHRLYPLEKAAADIRIFEMKENRLHKIFSSEGAVFEDGAWTLHQVRSVTKPPVSGLQEEGIVIENFATFRALEGFKPEIMDSVHEGSADLSIIDAVNALWLLWNQEVNLERIRGSLYAMVLLPLFAPLILTILFFFVPISNRFFNLALFSSGAVLATLASFGMLFALSKLAQSGTVYPEAAVLIPFLVVAGTAFRVYRKHR